MLRCKNYFNARNLRLMIDINNTPVLLAVDQEVLLNGVTPKYRDKKMVLATMRLYLWPDIFLGRFFKLINNSDYSLSNKRVQSN